LSRNGLLLGAIAIVLAIQVLIPSVPVLADAFHATHLSPNDWLVVGAIALVPAVFAQAWRTFRGTRWVG
jgi:Ca2+-transporting ATPase